MDGVGQHRGSTPIPLKGLRSFYIWRMVPGYSYNSSGQGTVTSEVYNVTCIFMLRGSHVHDLTGVVTSTDGLLTIHGPKSWGT